MIEPTAGGFMFRRISDLIKSGEDPAGTRSIQQQLNEFQLQLRQYLEGKGVTPRRAAIKYLIEDCDREIAKAAGNRNKLDILKQIHSVLMRSR